MAVEEQLDRMGRDIDNLDAIIDAMEEDGQDTKSEREQMQHLQVNYQSTIQHNFFPGESDPADDA